VTALPLIMFAAAARRLRLATMGLLQYSVPSIQFLLAVYLFAEPLGIVKLGTFMLIWLALVIFTTDALARERRATAR
jgi:chloramphenicol-sensitive protein RarD